MSRPPNGGGSIPQNGYPRNGSGSIPPTSRLGTPQLNQRPQSPAESPNMSRAERFEDEKRRIVESCFSKLDQNGQLAESYITHIRILEDAQYPSAPPPPDSTDSNKKPRLIIIAVRSTGRVRMHKARENNNGSFSIGKTWNMEELSAIESFSHSAAPPQNDKEAQHRNWAGSVGFVVTITKPYYWQAGTPKEKDFFIASAVKIYRKYTKGQLPELRGFDDRERAVILGGAQPPPGQPGPPQGARQVSQSPAPAPPQPPFAQREQSREESRYRGSPGPPPSISDVRPGNGPGSRRPSESPAPNRFGPPPSAGLVPAGPRPAQSTDQMRAPSREARGPPEPRPGTSPGPGGFRQPSDRSIGGKPLASPMRAEGPGLPPVLPPVVAAPSPLRPLSPPKQREPQAQGIDGVADDRKPSTTPSANGTSSPSGANLFAAARERYMNYQSGPSPTPPPHSKLPPIETSRAPPAQNGTIKNLVEKEKEPHSANTESSAGIDLGDAAAIGALTAYWGPEHTPSTPHPPATPVPAAEPESMPRNVEEPPAPATPERAKQRPQMAPKPSQGSIDLRPAPLNQSIAVAEDTSARSAPPAEPISTIHQPPPEVKPLAVQKKSETRLPMPGAFSPALMQPSNESSPAQTPQDEKEEEEAYRPGLGPMFKKKAIADRFKRAANTATAFKPRPGGAAEKILQAKADRNGEPDGITGVVPRPGLRKDLKEEPPMTPIVPDTPPVQEVQKEAPPTLEVISPTSPSQPRAPPIEQRQSVELFDDTSHLKPAVSEPPMADEEKLEQRQIRQPQIKLKRRSAQQEKYLAALDIDRSLLDGRGIEFEYMLSDFGWNHDILSPKALAILESDIRREQGRVEAGSWLSHTDAAREERVTQVENLLDKAIAECDELEGLLTLYNVELSTLNDDIAFIEAQSQGLQVQSANQKLLQSELQGMVDMMSLDKRVLEPIRYADLGDARSLEDVELCLVRLYQAMILMDPSKMDRPRSRGGYNDNEAAGMAALREKKVTYDRELNDFCKRLVQFLDSKFTISMNAAKKTALRIPTGGGLAKLHADSFNEARAGLWMYSPVILFTKELNQPAWQTLMRMYHSRASILYGDAFKENISNWKRAARATSSDDADLLFTTQEKEDPQSGGLASTAARKLTVKRSQTLAKTLRNASGGDKHGSTDRIHKVPGAMMRSQAFASAMDEMMPLLSREQNFFVDLFHAHSLDSQDFVDAVESTPPGARRGTNLLDRKPTDPDRNMAHQVNSMMGEIFSFFTRELDAMLNWSISEDPIQGVGVMASLSRHGFFLQDSSQEYLLQLVRELSDKLQGRFTKFVDEQIRAIEDTKVKIKKRKGVIAFMKIFPNFAAAVENVFASVAGNDYDGPADCMMEVRKLLDDAYERLNKAMFDSLKVIAKESPVAGVPNAGKTPVGDDPDDKEMLNYHILLIENMNHYVEDVDDGGRPQGVLGVWKDKALKEREIALEAYVGRVIRRPLGKLLDFVEACESVLNNSNSGPSAVTSRPSYSRKAMRTVLSQYDAKEIRRGIDTLRKRIEKHFGEADDEHLSRQLVGYVCKECERKYEQVLERIQRLVREVYPPTEGEKDVVIDFSKADFQAGFRR